jgi:hypothetical protein
VRAGRPQPVERDGDPAAPSTELHVEVVPRALALAVPSHQVEASAPVRREPGGSRTTTRKGGTP